jgi:hypothetical protein
MLFASFSGHARRAAARANSKPFACKPRLKDAPYDIEGTRLHYSAADELAAPYTDTDDAPEGEGKLVGGMLVEQFWVRVGTGSDG